MTDRPAPPSPAPDDDALAAYLAGDLDERDAAAVEAHLDDPRTAARLDAIADVVARLRAVDEVEPPQGYAERLGARLDAERDGTVTSLDEARVRRRWAGVGTAAAVLILVAVGSLAVLRPFGGAEDAGTPDTVAMQAEEGADARAGEEDTAAGARAGEPTPRALRRTPPPDADAAAPEAAVPEPDAADDAAGEPGADEGAAADGGGLPPASDAVVPGPDVVVDDTFVPTSGDDEVAARFSGLPEVAEALGTPIDVARDRVVAAQRALALAPTVAGSPVDACLATALPERDPPLVVRAQGIDHAGQEGIAYVVVSSAGGQVLDRAEVVVVEPAACTRLATVVLPDG